MMQSMAIVMQINNIPMDLNKGTIKSVTLKYQMSFYNEILVKNKDY